MTDYTVINAVAAKGKSASFQITTSNHNIHEYDRAMIHQFIARALMFGVSIEVFIDGPQEVSYYNHVIDDLFKKGYELKAKWENGDD